MRNERKKVGCKFVTFDSHRRRLPHRAWQKSATTIYRYTSSVYFSPSLPPSPSFDRDFRPSRVQQRRPFLSKALRHRLPAPLLFFKSYYASRWRVSTNPFMRFLLISGTGTVPFLFLDPRLSIASARYRINPPRWCPRTNRSRSFPPPSRTKINLKDPRNRPRDYSRDTSLPPSFFHLLPPLLLPYRAIIFRGDGVSHRGSLSPLFSHIHSL